MQMDILIATDDKFVNKYLVMLVSLFENNKKNDICIHLIRDELLSDTGLQEITKIVSLYGKKLRLWQLEKTDKNKLSGIDFSKWGMAATYRLLALSIFKDMDRFLWLDGDIIVQKDLSDFYRQNFEDNYLVACRDIAITHQHEQGTFQYITALKDNIYYNSGVVLFNLKKIRDDKITEAMWDWTKNHTAELIYPDQDIINCVFNGKIKGNDPFEFNCQAGAVHWTKERKILSDTSIIHFVGTKPWDKDYRKRLSSAISGMVWWKYAIKIDAWKNEYKEWKFHQIIHIMPWNAAYKIYWTLSRRKKKYTETGN